jgi:hypothetical protein
MFSIIIVTQIGNICFKNTVVYVEEKGNVFKVFIGKPEGKRPLRRNL